MDWEWILAGVLTVGGIGAIIATLGFGAPVVIGIAGGGLAVAGGAVGYDAHKRTEVEKLLGQLRDLQRNIDGLTTRLNSLQAERESLVTQLQIARNNNYQFERNIGQLQRNYQNAQTRIDELQRERSGNHSKISTLRRRLEELGVAAGGNGFFENKKYSVYYYSFLEMDRCLNAAINHRFLGFAPKCQFLLATEMSSVKNKRFCTFILPSVSLSQYGLMRLYSNLNTEEFVTFLSRLAPQLDGRLIFPYLVLDTKHWVTVEIQIQKNAHHQFHINYTLHDPRGKGQIQACLTEKLQTILQSQISTLYKDAVITSSNSESPYQSCRQSKPDKISCGPIVIKEIEKRIMDQSLDRQIPYEFGAWEIVSDQQGEAGGDLEDLGFARYEFLSNT